MDVKYREGNTKDAPFILDILNSVSGDIKNIDSGEFLVAENKDKIIGCVRIQNINGHFKLASFAVLPDYRKNGIGSTLIVKILDKNIKKSVYLFCNIKNEGFLKKFGFKRVEIENIPEIFKKDYNDLINRNFTKNTKLLIAMVLI